jgi:hypothetical protein
VGRAAALLGLAGGLIGWYEAAPHVGGWSLWPDIVLIAFVIMPACFALVGLALPLWRARGLLPVGLACAVLAFALAKADLDVAANFAKLAATTLLAWWFLTYFEDVSWIVLVAAIIPWVDAYSVWRGPTKEITTKHEEVFSAVSVGFVVPGGGAARLGLPDVLFFALFLGAAARFALRPFWTWLGLVTGLGITIVVATWWDVGGLPALPALSLGFLVPNADLLWRRLRSRRRGSRRTCAAPASSRQAGRPGSDTARTYRSALRATTSLPSAVTTLPHHAP